MIRTLAAAAALLLSLSACGSGAQPAGDAGAGGAGGEGGAATTTSVHASSSSSGTPGCDEGEGGAMVSALQAYAGPDQTVEPGELVFLQGSAESPRCDATFEYAWERWGGFNDITLDDPSSPSPTFTAPMEKSTLEFQLRVTDDEGETATSLVMITVGHAQPTAHAGPDVGALGGTPVMLIGSGSDPANLDLGYAWTQVDGPPVSLLQGWTATPSLVVPQDLASPLVFALTVSNDYVSSAPDWVTVRRLAGPDTDGDLLDDDLELTLGTNPDDPDTDHDGIPDAWEVLGHEKVDYPALGCDPLHRDLLVELAVQEYMKEGVLHSARPSTELWATLSDFYAALPLPNPDGTSGVALHVVEGLPLDEAFSCGSGGEFCSLNDAPGNFLYREAFHKVSLCTGEAAGCADLGGRRFSVDFDAANGNDLAGPGAFAFHRVFIHEMGHNLGLHHGGQGDEVNHKPNYPSLMNYAYLSTTDQLTFATGQVMLSHGVVPPLDECAVVEQGIFASVPAESVAFLPSYEQGMGWSVAADGSVDWNRDGLISADPYVQVLRPGGGSAESCTLLLDHDDFAGMDEGIAPSLPSCPSTNKVLVKGLRLTTLR